MREFLAAASALADANRVRALLALEQGELCLCDLTGLLGLAPSTVSRHMSLLWQAGLVERRRAGRWHYFRLPEGRCAPAVARALAWVRDALADDPAIAQDRRRLESLCCPPGAATAARR